MELGREGRKAGEEVFVCGDGEGDGVAESPLLQWTGGGVGERNEDEM